MLILLTNDDGIRAPGIAAALKVLREIGEVVVIAPETVQSATGHGVTLTTPLMTQPVQVDDQTVGTAVEGRPADCVKLAINQLMPRRPDLVVSGINSGANTGINVIYSGTVAAAIEAAFLGLPSIALSLLMDKDLPDWDHAAKLSLDSVKKLLAHGVKPGEVMSVNIPSLRSGELPKGTRVVRQCCKSWSDEYEKRLDPRGRVYFWNSSEFRLQTDENDTDVAALRDGYVTITPLQFDLTRHDRLSSLKASIES